MRLGSGRFFLLVEAEVEVVVVLVDAQDLVLQRVCGHRIEVDLDTVALDQLVVRDGLGGFLDLQLDFAVRLGSADAEVADLAECFYCFVIDLHHRAILRTVRILIAEDETIIRLDLRDLLERSGHEIVAEARDGEEAVVLARQHEPELAIMDVKMPKLDGIEAAKRILEERPIPIVMLTAYGQDELVNRAVEAGVFGYLVKPFREQDLFPAIATARARHEELAAVREEAESLADALAARKAIERAKGLLMEKEGLSEGDAFDRLRKASQVSGRPLKVIAEAVVATLDP
jgi:AmiR/NasT family two-component response regulator